MKRFLGKCEKGVCPTPPSQGNEDIKRKTLGESPYPGKILFWGVAILHINKFSGSMLKYSKSNSCGASELSVYDLRT